MACGAIAAAGGAGAEFPFTLETYNGAKIEFTKVPKRVISTNVNTGEELMALGLGGKIIGTCYNNASVAKAFRAEYEAKPIISEKAPSLEVVLNLEPDFIYGRSSAFGDKALATHITLSGYGIPSLSSIESYKLGADVEDVYQDFTNLGRIFNVQDRANAIIASMRARISAVESKVAKSPPVKVFVYDSGRDSGAYTPGNNFTSKLIRRAGGVNVFEGLEKTWNVVSWEPVVQADPDVIVINDYGNIPLSEKIKELKANKVLAGVRAVREERFVAVTLPEVFASSRVADTIELFAASFHPELFK